MGGVISLLIPASVHLSQTNVRRSSPPAWTAWLLFPCVQGAVDKCQSQYSYKIRFQNFVCTLWRFTLQPRGCSSAPRCGLSLTDVAWLPVCAPVALRDAGGLPSWQWPAWARPGSHQPLHGHLPLLSLSGDWGWWNHSLAAPSSAMEREVSRWVRGSLLITLPGWVFHHLHA